MPASALEELPVALVPGGPRRGEDGSEPSLALRTERRDHGELHREILAILPASPPWLRISGIADLTADSALQRHVFMVIQYTGGHLEWAADELGIDHSTLYRWLRSWGICRPVPRAVRRG